MQGRLQGKRLHARYFLDHVVGHGSEGCNYLLAVDVDMNTVAGYAMTSWDQGYGDMEFVMDEATIRKLSWLPATAMVQCDLEWAHEGAVGASPRSILKAQLARLAERDLTAMAGTELEFVVYEETCEAAWTKGYRDLVPANQYNVDYSILGTTRVEPLLRDIRNHMYAAGLDVEAAKGECNFGQHEIGFLYNDALTTADNHAVYKRRQGDRSPARPVDHLHGQAQPARGQLVPRPHVAAGHRRQPRLLGRRDRRADALYDRFIAGALATAAELTLFFAPNVNSYKRFADGSFAPTTIGWGLDNRTCAMRLVGRGALLG